jgi:glutamate synthase (NADPH/NADH) large chain
MVMPQYLPEFFPDLADERMESSVAVFHQRFSTNTLPQWRLSHPYRYLAHNGEINTISGNRNWAVARGPLFRSPLLPDLSDIQPLVSLSGSDSQTLDNMLEVLLAGGLTLFMVPAILRLMGRATHWIPKWLNKILPHVDIEGEKLLEKTAEADAPAKAPGA